MPFDIPGIPYDIGSRAIGPQEYYAQVAAYLFGRSQASFKAITSHFFDFSEGGTTRTATSGVVGTGTSPSRQGGWCKFQVGDGASAGALSVRGASINGATSPVHLTNSKTDKWLAVWKGKATATPGATTRVGLAFSSGNFRAGIVKASHATQFCAVFGATTIVSAVPIDTGVHVVVAWHDGTNVYLCVDDELPVSAANTNLPTTSEEMLVDYNVGAGEARQDPETDYFGIFTERLV